MNNLTPLQEVASRIYCTNKLCNSLDFKDEVLRDQAITEAKAFLEATKPEPLEWKDSKIKGYAHPLCYSKAFEFVIVQTNGGLYNVCSTKNIDFTLGSFPTFDKAKQFAEHIRTR
jgi:hypothetical protein